MGLKFLFCEEMFKRIVLVGMGYGGKQRIFRTDSQLEIKYRGSFSFPHEARTREQFYSQFFLGLPAVKGLLVYLRWLK